MREARSKKATASLTDRKIGRPSRSVSDRLDESLLDLAAEAFRESGYTEISLEGLAARIGVSKPTLYRRFENRSVLLEAIVARQFARLESDVGAGPNMSDPLASLRAYARNLFLRFLQPDTSQFIRFLIQESSGNPRLTTLRRQWHDRVLDRLERCIADAQAAGALAGQDRSRLANLVVDLIYTPINLRLMAYDETRILTGMTPEAFFTWRFGLFERLG